MGDLKPGWKRVKFGEVVRLVKETCKDPAAAGIDRVIGLEHLEPGDLRVRSWNDVADGTTFTTRVRPGQVLFGKRRAYQRKVAVADFDAICSGDIYVFESANPEKLLPELLPFLCQTDSFFDHAVGTSAGSLSPRTNWSSLAEYEFALPPLEEQHRLAGMLASLEEVRQQLQTAKFQSVGLRDSLIRETIDVLERGASLQSVCLPIVRGIDSPGPDVPTGTPYVRIAEMTGPEGIVISNLKKTAPEIAAAHPESRLAAGDFVVALRGVVGMPVRVPVEAAGANLSRGTARVSIRPAHNADYFYWTLRSPRVQREVLRVCTGWKGEDLREITLGSLRDLLIPVPRRDQQDLIAQRIGCVDVAHSCIEARLREVERTRRILSRSLNPGGLGVH